MEIDRSNFWEKLPTILETISEAQHVAVDLEMSGIHIDKSQQTPLPAKPTLQEMYGNARMAAETYTILQFGFTCISWDANKESYVTKTFNVPLHPGSVFDRTLAGDRKRASQQLLNVVDRCFRLSTNTLRFLEDADFSIPDVFQKGVPFLSEGEVLQQEIVDFIDGKRQTENLINVDELSARSKDFRNDVEEKIISWEKKPRLGGRQEPLQIDCANGPRFNSLEKRLVHELLQGQRPHLQAVAQDKGKNMLINDPSEYKSGLERYEREDAVRRQIGARLLWDAICGQPFADNVDHRRIAGDNLGKATMLRATLQGYERRLQSNRPVVIGHNILMDLCFLQRHFVGPLPASLHEFRALTRGRMPRVVDTKYLFSRGGDEMSPDHSLKECFKTMGKEKLPAVAPDPSHRYFKPRDHEAGWDSYMTAFIFLKKSHQLSQAGVGLLYIASEDLGEDEVVRHRGACAVNPLETIDQEDATAMAKLAFLQPGVHPAPPVTAPPTPRPSPGPGPSPKTKLKTKNEGESEGAAMVPEWEGPFWSKYGNRSVVGMFRQVLYLGRMAGEGAL